MSFSVPSSSLTSEALRNLDPSLTFALTVQNHQDLLLQTSSSSLSGILKSLEEGQSYANAIKKLHVLVDSLRESMEFAKSKEFLPATAAQTAAHKEEAMVDLNRWVNTANSGIANWAATLSNISPLESTGVKLVSDLRTALNGYTQALASARTGNFAGVSSSVANLQSISSRLNQEISSVTRLRDEALSRWNSSSNSVDLQDYYKWNRELGELGKLRQLVSSTTSSAETLNNRLKSDHAALYQHTPTVHSLGGEVTLATWGSSGSMTLVGPNGEGLRIHADGSVDSLGSDTKDWKVNQKTTFVFAEGVKISITPGNPASVQAFLGNELLQINQLAKGQPAAVSLSKGGRELDAKSSDGQVVTYNSSQGYWKHGDSNLLGDSSSREMLSSGQYTEALVCGVDIAIPEELVAYFDELGIEIPDLDKDGRFNESELMAVNFVLNHVIELYQQKYSDTMSRIREETDALKSLTNFMEAVKADQHGSEMDQLQLTPEQQQELHLIEERLQKAMRAVADGSGDGQSLADSVKQALSEAGLSTGPGSVAPASTITSPTTSPSSGGEPTTSGPSFSRASRLLGGPSQLQELMAQFQQSQSTLSAPALLDSNLASMAGWLQESGFSVASVTEGLNALLQQAEGSGLGAGDLGQLQALLTSLVASGEQGLTFALQPSLQESLLLAGFSASEIEALTSILAKAELVVGVDGKVPTLLSELGLGQLTSSMLSLPQGPRARMQEHFMNLVDSLSQLSASELRKALNSHSEWSDANPNDAYAQAYQDFSRAYAINASASPVGAQPMGNLFGTSSAQGALGWLRSVGEWSSHSQVSETPGASSLALLNQWSQRFAQGSDSNRFGLLGGFSTGTEAQQAIQAASSEIVGNIMTAEELLKRFESNLQQATELFKIQMREAEQLFYRAQDVVQDFFVLLKQEDLGKDVVQSNDLSDDLRSQFKQRMDEFRIELGVEWGSSETSGNAAQESKRINRMMQSGMMV